MVIIFFVYYNCFDIFIVKNVNFVIFLLYWKFYIFWKVFEKVGKLIMLKMVMSDVVY